MPNQMRQYIVITNNEVSEQRLRFFLLSETKSNGCASCNPNFPIEAPALQGLYARAHGSCITGDYYG